MNVKDSSTRKHHITLGVLLVWLLVNILGIHLHLCFDGIEPPIALHVDVLKNHFQDTNKDCVDIEIQDSKNSIVKLFGGDLLLIIASFILFFNLFKFKHSHFLYFSFSCFPRIIGLRPLLRAPPSYSV